MIASLTPVRLDVVQRTTGWLAARQRGGPGNPYPCTVTASQVWRLFDAREVIAMWREHVLGEVREVTLEEREAMDAGIAAEPKIIRAAADVLGVTEELEAPTYTLVEMPWLVASLDAVAPRAGLIIEAKLIGKMSYERLMAAGDVLPRHRLQVVMQMLCSGLRDAWVAYRHRQSQRMAVLPVAFDEETAMLLVNRARLYCEHVAARVMPWRLDTGGMS